MFLHTSHTRQSTLARRRRGIMEEEEEVKELPT